MSDTMTPEQIAAKLTKAQRRAVMQLSADKFTSWDRVYRQRRQRISGHALGVHEPEQMGPVVMWCNIRLTPLGLAVRAIIEKEAAQ